MLSILVVIFLLIIGFNLGTFSLFWYETANGPHKERLDELSGGHPRWWLARGFFWGLIGMAMVPLTFPLGWIRKLWQPDLDRFPSGPVIFLVHGLYHNPSAWLLYRWWLKRHGFRNIVAAGYRSWYTDFDRVASECRQQLSELVGRYPDIELVLIGHSMGGLVIRSSMNDPAIAERVRAMVTLGTPHQGSKLAALAWGRLGRSLSYRGAVVTGLQQIQPAAQPAARLALVTPTDNMVLPNGAGRPEMDGWITEYTAPVSHVCLLYHRPTFRKVARFIEQAADPNKE